MKVGLFGVGDENWIGGVYYVSNLIDALQQLPDAERPELLLIARPEMIEKYFADKAVPVLPSAVASSKSPSTLRSVAKYSLSRLPRSWGISLGLKLSPRIDHGPLVAQLRAQGVSLVFPCQSSMKMPWLPWVWDFQHKYYPGFFSSDELLARDMVFARFAAEARLIVVSSRNAQEDYERFFPAVRGKLRILHFHTAPVPHWYAGDVDALRKAYDLPERYLMLPNQFWVHKNHQVVFEAVNILAARGSDVTLVCTGHTHDYRRPGHFQSLQHYLQGHSLERRVRILGMIPRFDQIQIMRGAVAIVQPSLFEGWSTVVEDARLLGRPMILSDLPVHREQNPPGAAFFDPSSPEDLAQTIRRVWETFPPGPDLLAEQIAFTTQQRLVAQFARDFLNIARELLALER